MSIHAGLFGKEIYVGPKADAILARPWSNKKTKKRKADEAGTSLGYSVMDVDGGWGVAATDELESEEVIEPVVARDLIFKWEIIRKAEGKVPRADEQPLVFETEEPQMASLLTAEQVKKNFGKKAAEKVEAPDPSEMETVYRDVSGRKIDAQGCKS